MGFPPIVQFGCTSAVNRPGPASTSAVTSENLVDAMDSSNPTLLLAAHGTASSVGAATLASIASAVAAARPSVPVGLCFLDVASPSLSTALAGLAGPVVVVPLLLSSGYHVLTDIPSVVARFAAVRVARHLGPDPVLADVLASRLAALPGSGAVRSTALVCVGSTRGAARDEVSAMAALLAARVGRPVSVVPLFGDVRAALAARDGPVSVATYLIAEGAFLGGLRAAVSGLGEMTEPFGPDPALVDLVLQRYDEAVGAPEPVR